MARRRRGGRRRRGIHVGLVPMAGLLTSAFLLFHDTWNQGSVQGGLSKVGANFAFDWPKIIGIPLAASLAAKVARGVGNPRFGIGGLSVSAF